MYDPIYGITTCDRCQRPYKLGVGSNYIFIDELERAGWVFDHGELLCPDCASGKNIGITSTNLLTSYGL